MCGFSRKVRLTDVCTPGTGVNLWGESPLYVNPVNVFNTLTKVLAEGKGIFVRGNVSFLVSVREKGYLNIKFSQKH